MVVPGRLVVVREGYGEAQSIENLVVRIVRDRGFFPGVFSSIPESPRIPITSAESAVRAAEIAATQDPAAALLTADLDDDCPKEIAPEWAAAVRARGLPFPIALVLFHREFETLAMSVSDRLGGRELISPAGQVITTLEGCPPPSNPEGTRDAKGWVGKHLMAGRSYKPTVHQLPLTRAMSVPDLRAADLSSFRRLESGITFLAESIKQRSAGVYPPSIN